MCIEVAPSVHKAPLFEHTQGDQLCLGVTVCASPEHGRDQVCDLCDVTSAQPVTRKPDSVVAVSPPKQSGLFPVISVSVVNSHSAAR